ncbi:MAG: carbonate dehydratase [Chloroflexota bacterium]
MDRLLLQNRTWATERVAGDPDYFRRLAGLQAPDLLWIGCSDSRVPANVIAGLEPGEVFVHRNVANVVVHTDVNCLSVLQYAVDVLQVEHVIVCGHYGCGGVTAALDDSAHGLIDNWLGHVRDIAETYADELAALPEGVERRDRLCELNVLTQARNVERTTIVQDARRRGQSIDVHAWIYRLDDGLLRDLGEPTRGR